MRIEVDEASSVGEQKCLYCGHYLADFYEETTERKWRKYWIGVVGQPIEWNKRRKTEATQLQRKKKMQTKSRMYEVNGKRVRTWNVFKGCKFDCVYCVQREQAKRQKHRCEKCYLYEPHMHTERLSEKFKPGETVFVAAAGDISFASFDQFADILDVISYYPDTNFYIQSKTPAYFAEYLDTYGFIEGWNPDVDSTNVVLGTTIETSRSHSFSPQNSPSNPPYQISRAAALQNLDHPRKYVTIEPIFDFDAIVLIAWLKAIAPEFVYVGYLNPLGKAKKSQLPEPSLEKTKKLCKELAKFTEVRLKTMRLAWWEPKKQTI